MGGMVDGGWCVILIFSAPIVQCVGKVSGVG